MVTFFFVLNVALVGGIIIWYLLRVRVRNTVTVQFNKLTRAIVYDIFTGRRWILQPGTYSLPANIKIVEKVDTNMQQVRGPDNSGIRQTVRSGQVEFEVVYEYGWWYIRSPGANEATDPLLSQNVLRAYERYDKQEERGSAVQQRLTQDIESIGRALSAPHLSNPESDPCDIHIVNGNIVQVVNSRKDAAGTLLAPPGRVIDISPTDTLAFFNGDGWVQIASGKTLLEFISKLARYLTNNSLNAFGMEVAELFVHDIPYVRRELQARAEKEYEAERLLAAVKKLRQSRRAKTDQEAMLIALGQDTRYADLVINTNWQKLIKDTVTVDNVVQVLDALRGRPAGTP